MSKKFYWIPLLFSFFVAPQVHALSVKQLTPEQLVGLSNCIVAGLVTDVSVDNDTFESGFMVKYFTIKVSDQIKGDCGSSGTFVFKQIVGVKGLPELVVGKSYVLFMPEAHPQTGLSAPVGIWQGQFELQDSGEGKMLVRGANWLVKALAGSTKNSVLSLSLTKSAENEKGVDYSTFSQAIRALSQEGK